MSVTGNIKFDVVPPTASSELRTLWGERAVILAASTREGEENLLLDALGTPIPEQLLVIVPRHPQRFEAVASLLTARAIRFQRRSENAPIRAETTVVLGDSMGEMFSYYAAADVAVIGGSMLPFGGQNLIEACAMGVPVIVGPHTFNFTQVAEDAIAAGAALRATSAHAALTLAQHLLANTTTRKQMAEAARAYATAQRGAVLKTMAKIEEKLFT